MGSVNEQADEIIRGIRQGGEDAILRHALEICQERQVAASALWNAAGKPAARSPEWTRAMAWKWAADYLGIVVDFEVDTSQEIE